MQSLIDTVQFNCDIVDARHAADFGMCTYLLKMRERYRWEAGLPLGAPLARDLVGEWLSAREAHLENLDGAEFRSLEVDGSVFDPFDADRLNLILNPRGMVYSAGLVEGARPNFFLAELESMRHEDGGFVMQVSGRELARCLNAPPAMTRGSCIFLRRESLRRYLWERYESWLWSRPDNAMARALACYPFDEGLDLALDQMTDAEMAVIEAHERGEHRAGLVLGDAWNAMLLDLRLGPAELMARAVRDHIADCSDTLPMLLDRQEEGSLHFFFANLGAMREQLFPALRAAYLDWLAQGSRGGLQRLAQTGARHWLAVAEDIVEIHAAGGSAAAASIAQRIDGARL